MNTAPLPSRSHTGNTGRRPGGRRSLWLVRGDEGYGVRRAMLGMADELRRRGVSLGFVGLRAGPFTAEIEASRYPVWILGSTAAPTDIRRRGWRFLTGVARLVGRSMKQRRGLERVIRSFDPDWIHLRSNSLMVLGGLAARRCGVPVFWHLPNTLNNKLPLGLQPAGCRLLCRSCGIVPLANSRHTAASLDPRDPRRVQVLYPGLDVTAFRPEAGYRRLSREDLGFACGAPLFLICARLVPEKAQDRVIAAAIELIESGHDLFLVIAGGPTDTPFFQQLQAQIAYAKAEARIRLLGPVADPRPWMSLADVIINSRTGAEPFGLTIVEAMLMERPVLAYAPGGPSETVVDSETGWLIHDPSVRGYRLGLERCLAEAARWPEMGEAARRRAERHFSVRATVDRYLQLVERHGGSRAAARTGEQAPERDAGRLSASDAAIAP